MSTGNKRTSRRAFLRGAAGAAAFTFVPRHVLGQGTTPPSEKLNIAGIGAGGQGGADINEISKGANIIALCDVDLRPEHRDRTTIPKFPDAKVYRDFRKMFDEMDKKIDAVVVGTPDHTHAVGPWLPSNGASTCTARSLWPIRSARSVRS